MSETRFREIEECLSAGATVKIQRPFPKGEISMVLLIHEGKPEESVVEQSTANSMEGCSVELEQALRRRFANAVKL